MNSSQGPLSHEVLLAAADLEERRLLFAELLEAGYEVMSVPGLMDAIRAMLLRTVAPPLIVLDVNDDAYATPDHVQDLLAVAPGVPVVLIVGAIHSVFWEPLRPQVAALLCRPITVGEVVEAVRRKFLPAKSLS